jgi:rfaE bifunctional protein nucleotidyltransferase chain/domain
MSNSRGTEKIILDHQDLLKKINALKQAGKTVVFSNGCFDLLHVGHIRYLVGAAAEGDILVAAINSDESIRKLKGPSRPVMPLAERMEIVAAFECVDFVTAFDGMRCSELLLLLKPDVHAKGTDYTAENVPERATVLGYGGRIAIVGDPKNHNSSEFIRRLGSEKKQA